MSEQSLNKQSLNNQSFNNQNLNTQSFSEQNQKILSSDWFTTSIEQLFPPLAQEDTQIEQLLFDEKRLAGIYLVPNQRTRQAIQEHYLRASGQKVSVSPTIFTIEQWLDYLFERFCFSSVSQADVLPKIVSRRAVEAFFLSALEQKDLSLSNPRGLARQLTESWRIYVHWLVSQEDLQQTNSHETQLFGELVTQLETLCKQKNLLTRDELVTFLTNQIDHLKGDLPDSVILYGIDELTPLQKLWLSKLANCGADVTSFYPAVEKPKLQKVVLGEISQAIRAAASYAKSKTLENADASLAIVIPDLAQRTADVHQIFSEVFHPEEYLPGQPINKPAYNVSAGISLARVPAVEALLALMIMDCKQLSAEDLSFIVNTCFFGWRNKQGEDVKSIAVAPLIQCLQREQYRWSVAGLTKRLTVHKGNNQAAIELLLPRLQALQSLPRGGSFLHWRKKLAEWIAVWQWPAIPLTDNDSWYQKFWQQVDAVAAQEKELAWIKKSGSGKNRDETDRIGLLKENLAQTVWQMPSNRSQIQVLGVLEATGLCFDESLLIGFHQGNWPSAAKPSAFLPWQLQVEKNMPGSSAKRETDYAKSLTRSLLHSANQVWIVETKFDKEQPLSPSPLFDGIEIAATNPLNENLSTAEQQIQKHKLENKDRIATRLIDYPLDKRYLPSSVSTGQLSNWSQCPFKFYAGNLLQLRQLPTSQLTFSPLVRGNWVHKSLEIMWQELSEQQRLLEKSEQQLTLLIRQSVQRARDNLGINYLGLPQTLIDLVAERLCDLLDNWFLLEKQRPDFKQVLSEQSYELKLGKLTIRVRLDRIDFDTSKSVTVIDYKTGKCSVSDWFGERPRELQMPIYALVMANSGLQQLGYGQIKYQTVEASLVNVKQSVNQAMVQKITAQGEITEPVFKRSKPDETRGLMEYWQSTLERLANYFVAGHFPVAPADNKACHFCEYEDVCRIDYKNDGFDAISQETE